jgi:hypothetical protein
MELTINQTHPASQLFDPLMACLYAYAKHIEEVPEIYGIQDMDTLFTFLQSRMEEFMNANPRYRKPASMELCYCRPSCCPATIRVAYLDQKFTIKYKTHENNPGNTHDAAAIQHHA